jgi:hypothetical protein
MVTKRRVLAITVCLPAIFLLYIGLVAFPDPCFAYEVRYGHLIVRSDEPIPASATRVLEDASARITRSPLSSVLNQPGRDRRIYVCNRPWRFLLFANFRYRVAGLTYAPMTNNIFLRAVHFDVNRLVGPSGNEVPGERTLSYFLAHEITHTLTADRLGAVGYWRLPVWKDEGYADYVGKGSTFDYPEAVRRLRQGDPQMDPVRSGLYLGYHLPTAYLLDKQRLSVDEFFQRPFDINDLKSQIMATPAQGQVRG